MQMAPMPLDPSLQCRPQSKVSRALAGLALLDLSEESETLAGNSVTLASSYAASSGPPSSSTARGPIGSLSLSEESTTLGRDS